ncbi:hypothetical protein QO003_002964 [Arthrobacter silviterrae]|uniref:DUF4232 domain-containing protein n=1 Tax=Arthrobacter silviterrae TaxID=2026658 RepID=A0ABX0DC06_9MICC|nr:DUF4232 domain-containing protein [Arthrobacter silviterrae]MDQ0278661.1 hypothetical protein [Arthrobacter silviterrae]NGN83355.1 DUF4232 domain-containing protein [Arthrobacter silviterrae]
MTIEQRTTVRQRTTRRLPAAALLGAAAVLVLAACGPSAGPAAGTSAATTAAPTTASAEPAPTTEAATSSAPSMAPSTAATPPLCAAASLAGSLDDTGGGAAGHIYMKLIVKNTSAATCILDGYPGVSLVKAGVDTPIGAAAVRDATAPSKGPISLAPGKSAAAVLRYTQAGNYPNCTRVAADSVMVYPPSATDRLVIAHPLTACSNSNIELLTIGAFQQ